MENGIHPELVLAGFSVSLPGSLLTAGRGGVHSESPTSFRMYCRTYSLGGEKLMLVYSLRQTPPTELSYVFHCGIEKDDLTSSNGLGPPSISMNRTAYTNTTNQGGKVSEISHLCLYFYE
jgi:hypothetical protein